MVPALVDVHKGTSNNTAFCTCISCQSADRPFSRDARVLRPLVGATSPALERPGELPSLPARLPSLNASLRRRGLPAGSVLCVPSEM